VNRSVRRSIAAEKRKIERRLDSAVTVNEGGPVLAGGNLHYELAEKTRATAHGGIGAIQRLVRKTGLAQHIDDRLQLLKVHMPYHESDHVLNIAYNALCGGRTLDDIEHRRNDRSFLDALGTRSIPDPTTAGDFCRRFRDERDISALQDAINEARLVVWQRQSSPFTEAVAKIDADGSLVPTDGECKEGMDIAYNGVWGYHALLVTLANTAEPLFIANRTGSRPSHEGVLPLFDRAITLVRRGGFKRVLLRGDTDFALTTAFDKWHNDGVQFVFGIDARKNLIAWGDSAPSDLYRELERRAEHEIKTKPRTRPDNVKDAIVKARGFTVLRTKSEDVIDFEYQPTTCSRAYRVVALRKNISVEKGEEVLLPEIRYFFYITNVTEMSCDEIVHEARGRCNQENLIGQLKSGVHALRAPVNTLNANWAYMVMAALAWSIKAWVALLLPIAPRWEKRHQEESRRVLTMEFRTFVEAFVNLPCQIVRTGRRILFRVLAWNRWQHVFFRLLDAV
jgi:Transposase DDE domain group 1